MFIKKKLMAVAACMMMFSAVSMLPGELSFIASAQAKEGGGGNGNGGGGGGGNGGNGGSGGSGGSGHSGGIGSNGQGKALSGDHDGKAVRDGGISGQHIGSTRTDNDTDGKAVRDRGLSGKHTGITRTDKDRKAVRDKGLSGKHTGITRIDKDDKAVRDRGVSGKHIGITRTDTDKDRRGSITSDVAHSKETRGLTKATSISETTPGEHNEKGLTNAALSTTKQDH
jgi:hypothetical protein